VIAVVTTGGTIAGVTGPDGAYAATTSGGDLLTDARTALPNVEFELHEALRKLSFEITLDEWLAVIARVAALEKRPDVDGVVVVQGTALLEEVPFLADLFVAGDTPLVFTGSMTPASQAGSDGAGNLLDALRVATDPGARSRGALVVMARRVLSARCTIKRHRGAPDALDGADGRREGAVDGAGVRWFTPPARRSPLTTTPALERRVALLPLALGVEADALARATTDGAAALVVEGFPGGGGVSASLAAPLTALAQRVPVVLSSRAPEGRLTGGAGGRSGGGALVHAGLISAGGHTTARARLVTMAALAHRPEDPHAAVRSALEHFDPSSIERSPP
jgi:L-asparaginase